MAKFRRGDYKVKCDRTGAIVNASDCRMQWNGMFVLKSEWEPRHPQDKMASISDKQAPPNARPEGEMVFIAATDVTAEDL